MKTITYTPFDAQAKKMFNHDTSGVGVFRRMVRRFANSIFKLIPAGYEDSAGFHAGPEPSGKSVKDDLMS